MLNRRPHWLDKVEPLSGLWRGLVLVALVLASLVTMAVLPAATQSLLPNIQMPTLGGTQVWRDEMVRAGWRVQRHHFTGHCRVLDDNHVRRAWGSCHAMYAELKRTAPRPKSRHVVLLVHGIARGPGTFGELPRALRDAGYDAVAISYPSTRASIDAHAGRLRDLILRLEDAERVSFVTHSMGGLLVRQLLADESWQTVINPGRLVMIAPPNRGSAIARFLKDNPAYLALYGPAGRQLVPDAVKQMPVPHIPFGIIAGGKGDAAGYNPLLPGDDDGTVSVAETRLEGAQAVKVLPRLHGIIARSPLIEPHVLSFLKSGKF
jgi:pimeloyl-ACP methyl ester carboxylesterase